MPREDGYIYRNENIDEDNFGLRVTVFAVGQGSCNLLEIYDNGKLVWLACIDFGTSSSKSYIDPMEGDYSPGKALEEKMKRRVEDGGLSARYYAYMDMFFLTHQDDDHHNQLNHLIQKLNQSAPTNKRKYIGAMYLGGYDYMKQISEKLAAGGVIGKAVEHMYHITQDNTTNGDRFYQNSVLEAGLQDGKKAVVSLNWIVSCMITNQTFRTPGTFPEPAIHASHGLSSGTVPRDKPVNFHNGWKRADAHSKNESSTLLHLSVYFPSRSAGTQRVSFLFPGDAEVKTFQAVNALRLIPATGVTLLVLMPHHGSGLTAYNSTRGNVDRLLELKRFISIFGSTKAGVAIASSGVTDNYLGHPASDVVDAFAQYAANTGIFEDYKQSCVVSKHGSIKGRVLTEKRNKMVATTEFVVKTDETDLIPSLDYDPQPIDKVKKYKLCRHNYIIEVTKDEEKIIVDTWVTGEMSTRVLVPQR